MNINDTLELCKLVADSANLHSVGNTNTFNLNLYLYSGEVYHLENKTLEGIEAFIVPLMKRESSIYKDKLALRYKHLPENIRFFESILKHYGEYDIFILEMRKLNLHLHKMKHELYFYYIYNAIHQTIYHKSNHLKLCLHNKDLLNQNRIRDLKKPQPLILNYGVDSKELFHIVEQMLDIGVSCFQEIKEAIKFYGTVVQSIEELEKEMNLNPKTIIKPKALAGKRTIRKEIKQISLDFQ